MKEGFGMGFYNAIKACRHLLKTYPEDCEISNKHSWIFKGNCVVCIKHPIEQLTIAQYQLKYPAVHTLSLGAVEVNLCDYHLREIQEYFQENQDDETLV